ncbi:MAG: patatin-like phospholipase family protein [Acidobacteriota bacterium]
MPDLEPRQDLALVMSGGGARAAYQAGVLAALARHFPDLHAPILTGVSAGAINAVQLAVQPGTFRQRAGNLMRIWSEMRVEKVFQADAGRLLLRMARSALRLASGGHPSPAAPRGLVETAPLRAFLGQQMQGFNGELPGIQRNLKSGTLRAVAITASSYSTGQSVTWIQACEQCEVQSWERAYRIGVVCTLTVSHVMASAALPVFFPAIYVDGAWYGDGGIRLTAPLSPAVHLGAGRILAISTRYQKQLGVPHRPVVQGYPPLAQVGGILLNALFLDQLDNDALRLERFNQIIDALPDARRVRMRKVDLLVIRPSRDLGMLANDYEARLPWAFRFLTRGLGTRETVSNDLLSLLMFQPDYLHRLIELGERDAEARLDEIAAFLSPGVGRVCRPAPVGPGREEEEPG